MKRFGTIVAWTLIVAALATSAPVKAQEKDAKPAKADAPAKLLGGPQCASQCASDVIADGFVNIDDLLAVINNWGICVTCPPTICTGDITHNCVMDIDDLLAVITGWGPCPGPVNDNCANYTILNNTVNYPFCTMFATTDGPAVPGCGFCCSDPQIHKDIWYGFSTSVFAGSYWISLDTCGANFDTKLAAYRFAGVNGCNCALTGATLVACNDDIAVCGFQSRLQFQLTASSCYRFRLGGYNGASGSGVLHYQTFLTGDECFNAIDLGTVTASSPVSVAGDNDPASNFTPGVGVTQAPCATSNDGRDVWYKFQIGCGGNVIGSVNTCDPFTSFDTILTLYRGSCDGLILVGCNDDFNQSTCLLNGLARKSLVDLPNPAPAGTYYVRVSGYQGATGNYRLKIGLSCIN
jgi:hypothetical protein